MKKIINSFLKTEAKYGVYDYNTAEALLVGDKPCSLIMQDGYDEPEYWQETLRECVLAYTRDKDSAITVFKDFISYYERKTGNKANIKFPPISISSTFERQMFIAKYLQSPDNKVSDLRDILWVGEKTIREDLACLRGNKNPIQVCGKVFVIPETTAQKGKLFFSSTAHPLFLTPNLTQVLVTLKGLKVMSEQEVYYSYAIKTAQSIWEQLSEYAKKRIAYVLENILPEDVEWYVNLADVEDNMFYSEYQCSCDNVFLDCIKNGKSFHIEYDEGDNSLFFTNCCFVVGSYTGDSFDVDCDQGRKTLLFEKVLRSSYAEEGLL